MLADWRQPAIVLAVAAIAATDRSLAAEAPGPLLDAIFQDHAVVQRDRPIAVWGDARSGDRVTVSIGHASISARADAAGHWRSSLPAMEAGGPYALTARSKSGGSESVSDVLVGDVWLCSGQSNMELPVSASLNGAREALGAANDKIRVLTVAHASNAKPLAALPAPAAWRIATPDAVRDFSAVCYFFGRKLQETESVAVGLINSSFGGSRIEPWISETGLRTLGGFDDLLNLLDLYARNPTAGTLKLGEMWEQWWRAHAATGSTPWAATVDDSPAWREVPEPMRDWKTWGVPELANHDGMVWFRRTAALSAGQASGPVTLSLGAIDEVDETWVNGRAIGNSFGWGTERTYDVPAGVLRSGQNSIVVNVLSMWDAGGMYGPPDHMSLRCADGSTVALGGSWQYQFVPDSVGFPLRSPWETVSGLASLHNAMIAPLAPYGLRGVVWYQGESNTANAVQYRKLLAGLMADWRREFAADLPFVVVQLPNFGEPSMGPAESNWASLREAQRRAVADDPHAALVVTIDIGERDNLHPPNKQEVGRRVALAARRLTHETRVPASGPIPLSAQREGGHVVVAFGNVEGTLLSQGANEPIGFELCGLAQASCRFANATMQASRVLLDGAEKDPPTRVRYCWGDNPMCNLRDQSGLPAGPFELEIR